MVRSRRDQLAEARRLGLRVEPVRRTGEVRVSPPDGGPSVRINNRRTDGTRAVEAMLSRYRSLAAHDDDEGDAMPTNGTPKPKPTAEEVARAFVKGRTTEEVIRAMAAEPKADPRLAVLVARYDARDARRAAKAAQEGATA